MGTKIRELIGFVLLCAASLTILLGSPNMPPNANAQAEPEVTVPGIMSTSNDNGGMRTLADAVLPSKRFGSHIDLTRASVALDRSDIRLVTMDMPNQIGINRSVAVSPSTRAQKFVNPDGSQIIVLVIKSSGASGIGVHFRNFALGEGDEVYVYGLSADSIVFGPYAKNGPWGNGEFWSGTLAGDTAVIEFYTKTGDIEKGFEIFEVSHVFAELDWRLRADEPGVLNCEVDASCYGDAEKNAVGRILYNDNGPRVCTGTLLNDRAQDLIPYFLTANHCVPTQAVAQTVEVYWFYQTTSCNGGVLRNWVHSPPGANLLATQASNDFSLVRLQNNAPGGAWFSGWTSVGQPTGTTVFGLHHPDAFIPPSIQSHLRRTGGSITSTNDGCLDLMNAYRIDWTSGTVEPGSSGSGLFTSNGHYVVGVLSCGPSPPTCSSPYAKYSKFANFYSQIQPYIDHPNAIVTTNPATNVASFSVTLNGTVNPGGQSMSVHFEYGTTTNYGFTTPNHSYTGNTTQSVSANVTGLNPNSTYHFRLVGTTAGGTTYGSDRTFTTLSPTGPPVVTTNAATLIGGFSATLNGSVDPHGLTTTVYFQYGTTTSYGLTTASQTKSGDTYQNISANISGLAANTTYHFRAVAANTAGTRYGVDRTFTTLSTTGPPVVTTNPPMNVTSSSATLKGTVNPHGLSTTLYFQYGTTNGYGSRTPNQTRTGNTYQNVSANISGLTAGTRYHFRIVATNIAGTKYGGDRAFTTP